MAARQAEEKDKGALMDTGVKDDTYDDLMHSAAWRDKLADLNEAIGDSLRRQDEPVRMNGNLFYRHKQVDFHTHPFVPDFEPKRRNFVTMARRSTTLFEVGVNGGHSMLLALMANPALKCVGVDVCAQLDPSWARVDIYVPAAFAWLAANFPGRVETITGNSLVVAPQYALDHPDADIDFLHLDGAKDTHLREVLALRGAMRPGAFVVHDDFNARPVRRSDRQLRRIRITEEVDFDEVGLIENRWHTVRRLV
jgi:predicted O-methyltransferase YrrM